MNKQIIFTRLNTAELLTIEDEHLGSHDVKVKTLLSTVSCGTERANITGDLNVAGTNAPEKVAKFPRVAGYSSVGIVEEVGDEVKSVVPGDRVCVYWGKHKIYNILPEERVVKIDDDRIDNNTAAMAFIATFPMAAVRKTKVELGETAMVMGLGILGQCAVQLMHAAGAVPVIAADPNPARREQALAHGADFALDPLAEGFAQRVKELTGGINAAVEVTGVGAGLDETLDCMAKFGRVALLGCTRDKNFTIDYYRKVHCPGISLIGAHTQARPNYESSAGLFTHRDDIRAVLKLAANGRICLHDMVAEIHSPADCGAVYDRLVNDRNFPTVVQFDWTKLD